MNRAQVLRQRTITGIIFSIIVVSLIISGSYGAALVGVAIAWVGSIELSNMVFPNSKIHKILSVFIITIVLLFLYSIKPETNSFYILLLFSVLGILGFIVHIFKPFIDFKKYFFPSLIIYLGFPIGLFVSFVLNSPIYCYLFWLIVIGLIWMTDSLAYLVGSRIGKTKLYERISPKKTWEGFLGAGIITVPIAWTMGKLLLTDTSQFYFISDWCVENSGIFLTILSVIVWITGTLGDLFESSIKRNFNVKDSGRFMPGHGGMLDRFDSFIFILPFVLLLLQIF